MACTSVDKNGLKMGFLTSISLKKKKIIIIAKLSRRIGRKFRDLLNHQWNSLAVQLFPLSGVKPAQANLCIKCQLQYVYTYFTCFKSMNPRFNYITWNKLAGSVRRVLVFLESGDLVLLVKLYLQLVFSAALTPSIWGMFTTSASVIPF